MSDGTIEEDFEEALAKEVAAAGELGSPETPMVNSKIFEGRAFILFYTNIIMYFRSECGGL